MPYIFSAVGNNSSRQKAGEIGIAEGARVKGQVQKGVAAAQKVTAAIFSALTHFRPDVD